MAAAQFFPITGEAVSLDTIVPTGEDLSDNVVIQTLDAYGYTLATYTWNDWQFDTACWIDNNDQKVTGVTFAPGQGLWVYGSSTSQSIQSCGKVGTVDVSVALRAGGTAAGNPFPVDIDLNDIVPQGDDLSDNVVIQTLDAYGYTVATYTWNDWQFDTACWIDNNDNQVTGVTIAAGQGLWIYGSSTSQYVVFPAPEL